MDIVELIRKHGLRRGLSTRTIETYCQCVQQFFRNCKKEPRKVTKKDVNEYLYNLAEKGSAGNTINVHLNSLRFLFYEILNKNFFVWIRYSKRPKNLPTVLSKEETKRLIDSISNEKHRLIVELMYAAGLRLSELLNLKVKDLEFDNRLGWVRHGKGDKDRLFIIAEKLEPKLKDFIAKNNLGFESYLFAGRFGRLSKSTIRSIVKSAAKKAHIQKNVHPHTLRHSFATHLIEDGYDVHTVQPLMGHNSTQTTMTYVHIASPRMISVKSPFDSLEENKSDR